MPWQPGNSPLAAAPEYEAYLFALWRAGEFSEYWQQPGLFAEGHYDSFPDVPVAFMGSWYDPYVYSCLQNFVQLSARKKSTMNLVMGPWTHGNRSDTHAGDVDFGPQSVLDGNLDKDYWHYRLAWFDRCLRNAKEQGEDNQVRYFQMGGGTGQHNSHGRLDHGGQWRTTDTWPVKHEALTLYFDAVKQLRTECDSSASSHHFEYDPDNPVPTIGGALTSGEPIMRGGAYDQRVTDTVFTCQENAPHSALAQRPDVLVFQTAPLEQDLIVTGEIEIVLWVSSDCPDTDFTAKIIDVYPESETHPHGFAMNITDGLIRMRYREGLREGFRRTDGVGSNVPGHHSTVCDQQSVCQRTLPANRRLEQ